jgi:hypothetical protein
VHLANDRRHGTLPRLVHAFLPDTFMYHALVYACQLFNVLPVKGLYFGEHVSMPYELFQWIKPSISHFRVFGCPITACKWATSNSSNGKQTKHGIRGIFLGFDQNQIGYMFYAPASHQLYISADTLFDEQFSSTIVHLHHDSLAFRTVSSDIPLTTTTIEHSSKVAQPIVEEGTSTPAETTTVEAILQPHSDDNVPDLINMMIMTACLMLNMTWTSIQKLMMRPEPASVFPQAIAEQAGIRRSTRARKPNPKYVNLAKWYEWESNLLGSEYHKLARACAIGATTAMPMTRNALSWEPAPSSTRDILKMPERTVHQE